MELALLESPKKNQPLEDVAGKSPLNVYRILVLVVREGFGYELYVSLFAVEVGGWFVMEDR